MIIISIGYGCIHGNDTSGRFLSILGGHGDGGRAYGNGSHPTTAVHYGNAGITGFPAYRLV